MDLKRIASEITISGRNLSSLTGLDLIDLYLLI
jgi:hypothetical protein